MLDTSSRTAFNEDHAMFRDTVRKVFEKELIPNLDKHEREGIVGREFWLACDAAHMVAISDEGRMLEWTERGLALDGSQPDAAYWAGPLLNNLGWAYFDAGEHERALELFEQALVVRERDPGNPAAIQFAKEAVDEARQALAR